MATTSIPVLVAVNSVRLSWPVCLQCDMLPMAKVSSLRKYLGEVPLEPLLRHHAPLRQAIFDPALHDGHDVVPVVGTVTIGPRTHPGMAQLLGVLAPDLVDRPHIRRGERGAHNPQIQAALAAMGFGHLFRKGETRLDHRRWVGAGTGSQRQAPKGTALTATPISSRRYAHGDLHVEADVVSGITKVESLIVKGKELRQKYEAEHGERLRKGSPLDADRIAAAARPAVDEDVCWVLFGLYVDLMAHMPGFEVLTALAIERKEFSSFTAMIACLPKDPVVEMLVGDLAVLEYKVGAHCSFLPGAWTAMDLVAALRRRGYSRLKHTKDASPAQQFDMMIKAIAMDMDFVVVYAVDWGSVVSTKPAPGNVLRD